MSSLEIILSSRICDAAIEREPFEHIVIKDFAPPVVYQEFVAALPETRNYVPMTHHDTYAAGRASRLELHLPRDRRELAAIFSGAPSGIDALGFLGSDTLSDQLKAKFRIATDCVSHSNLYRDLEGFDLKPHTDIPDKVITLGWYLPRDASNAESGLALYAETPRGFVRRSLIPYIPNLVFAFARTDASWHGARHACREPDERNSLFVTLYRRSALEGDTLVLADPNIPDRRIPTHSSRRGRP